MSRAAALLLEHRLLFREFGDAIEARSNHHHLLFLFRIGDHFAERADFLRMLKPESYIA
jgi:hypothetical protein